MIHNTSLSCKKNNIINQTKYVMHNVISFTKSVFFSILYVVPATWKEVFLYSLEYDDCVVALRTIGMVSTVQAMKTQ